MYRKDPMLEEIHKIRKRMWDESGHNPHSLIENIQKEAKDFIERCGYRYVDTEYGYRKIVDKNADQQQQITAGLRRSL